MRVLPVVAIILFSHPSFAGEPTEKEFTDYTLSGISFLQQCMSLGAADQSSLPDDVFRMSKSLGLTSSTDWFSAMQRGSNGEVYDMLRERWITMTFSKKSCGIVNEEMGKVKVTLARYF